MRSVLRPPVYYLREVMMFSIWDCGCIGIPEGAGAWILRSCDGRFVWEHRPEQGTKPYVPMTEDREQALHAQLAERLGHGAAYDRLRGELRLLVRG